MKFKTGEEVWYHAMRARVVTFVGGAENRYYIDTHMGRHSVPEIHLFKSNTDGSRTPQIQYEPRKKGA